MNYGYIRVSSDKQTVENQRFEIENFAKQNNFKIDGCTVHTYNDGDLIACFDANIPESVVKEIAKRNPLRAVFRDSGFASSPEKINVFEIFKLYMPEDANDISKRVRVI